MLELVQGMNERQDLRMTPMVPMVEMVLFSEIEKTGKEKVEIKNSALNVLYTLGLEPPPLCKSKYDLVSPRVGENRPLRNI